MGMAVDPAGGVEVRAVVPVGGMSGQFAVGALGERGGHRLDPGGSAIAPLGGATSIGRLPDRGPARFDSGPAG